MDGIFIVGATDRYQFGFNLAPRVWGSLPAQYDTKIGGNNVVGEWQRKDGCLS